MPIFSVDDLRVKFGDAEVVRGVSFAVEPGKTLAIVGESGSGKSVSLLGATGLLPPTAAVQGSVVNLAGREVAALAAQDLPQGISTLLWDRKSTTGTRAPADGSAIRRHPIYGPI